MNFYSLANGEVKPKICSLHLWVVLISSHIGYMCNTIWSDIGRKGVIHIMLDIIVDTVVFFMFSSEKLSLKSINLTLFLHFVALILSVKHSQRGLNQLSESKYWILLY